MSKKNHYILLVILIFYSAYCAVNIGQTWDEEYELLRGKTTLDYFFSLGRINNYIPFREYNSTLYYTFNYFFTQFFPIKYQIESSHLINLTFSLSAIFGFSKVCKELFNKKVAHLSFLILFFFPTFFGHMAFNSKDTILAFSHVWITYLIIKYLKKQNINNKKTARYIFTAAILASMATGIKLVFLGSLIPLFFFVLIEIFLVKKNNKRRF